ncbi:MAG: hypothetical protein ACLRMZ_17060 [Blautia marasmi]
MRVKYWMGAYKIGGGQWGMKADGRLGQAVGDGGGRRLGQGAVLLWQPASFPFN